MVDLREDLELRLKVEIHEIEERKNQHINDLMREHQKAFRQMKNYYNDITRVNLKLIRSYKDEIAKIDAQIISNSKALNDITAQN